MEKFSRDSCMALQEINSSFFHSVFCSNSNFCLFSSPNEIIIQIFSYLIQKNREVKNIEFNHLAKTCKRFYKIIQLFNPDFRKLTKELLDYPDHIVSIVNQIYHSYLPHKEKFEKIDQAIKTSIALNKADILTEAIQQNEPVLVKHLLHSQAFILDQSTKRFALRLACELGLLEIVHYLFEEKTIELNLTTSGALEAACRRNHLKIVRYLLNHHQFDLKTINQAVKLSSSLGRFEIIKELFKNLLIDVPLALAEACAQGHIEIIQLLLQKLTTKPPEKMISSIFRRAIDNNQLEAIRCLLSHPYFDPSVSDNDPVRYAANHNKIAMGNLLLADPRVSPFRVPSNYLSLLKKIQISTLHLFKQNYLMK